MKNKYKKKQKYVQFRESFFYTVIFIFIVSTHSVVAQTVVWERNFEASEGITSTACTNTSVNTLANTTCVPTGWQTGRLETSGSAIGNRWYCTGQWSRTGDNALAFWQKDNATTNRTGVGGLISHGATLTAGVTYALDFYYRIPGSSNVGTFKMYVGHTMSSGQQAAPTFEAVNSGRTNTTWNAANTYTFTPSVTGTYYMIFKTTNTTSNTQRIIIDDMVLYEPSTLPVTVKDFSSECQGDNLNLRWTTASEQNASHFDLQRSIDGYEWTTVRSVPAKGNSSVEINYEITDNKSEDIVYYRLYQVDVDGKGKTFNSISVNCAEKTQNMLTIAPNPARNNFVVNVTSKKEGKANMYIVDLSGKIVYFENINLTKGSNMIFVNEVNLATGTYMLNIEGETERFKPTRLVCTN